MNILYSTSIYKYFIPSAEVKCSVQFEFACVEKNEVLVPRDNARVRHVVYGAFGQFDLEAVDLADIMVQKEGQEGQEVDMDANIEEDDIFLISKHSYEASQNKTYQFQVTRLNANKLTS